MIKLIVLTAVVLSLFGCGGGSSPTSATAAPPQTSASLAGSWSGDFPIYTCDVTLVTTDNVNYTGHIMVKQKPVLNYVPEWFSADISGKLGSQAMQTNVTSTYPLNGGVAGVIIIADNYFAPATKIGCMVGLHYGTEGFDTNVNGDEWLVKK